MADQLKTAFPEASSVRHIGSIPGCLALAAHDIGEAVLTDGRTVLVTWGANMTAMQARDWARHSTQQPVRIGTCWEGDEERSNYEIMLTDEQAVALRPILR